MEGRRNLKKYLKVKRIIDIMVSGGAVVILSPVLIGIALAIKLDSPGSVLFKQKRVGRDKELFDIWKFRTMYRDTPKDMPTHMLKNPDKYITKVGKFLRRTSLDELPQLFQILSGKMSICGPRPALWNQYDLIAERDKYGVNSIVPGLTGWAQINGRDELEIPVKAKLDGEYAENLGFWMDVKCFLGTIGAVLRSDGIVEGGTGELHKQKYMRDETIKKPGKVKEEIYIGAAVIGIITTMVSAGIGVLTVCRNKGRISQRMPKRNLLKKLFFSAAIVETIAILYTNWKRKAWIKNKFSEVSPKTMEEEDKGLKGMEPTASRKILITGAGSYVGMAVEQWLMQHPEKYQVDTLDMVSNAWKEFDFSGYDVVYHVAGIAHADVGAVTEEQKALYYQVNTDLAVETAKKAKAAGVKQFIFMSSMIVYSGCKEQVITERTNPQPLNFYGDSKWQADQKVRELESEGFKVVVLRPPMIYGKGSKGNYPELAKLASKLPVFPIVRNKRSMLYIDNLCEFVKLMIDNEESGVFFPQNSEYANTSDLVQVIGKVKGNHIIMVPGTNMAVKLLGKVPGKIGALASKAFGDSIYGMEMSEYKQNYRVYSFVESIKLTESMEKESKKKHILVISQYFYPESFRINDMCREWVKRGYQVTVLTGIPNYPEGEFYTGYDYDHFRTEKWNGMDIIRLYINPRKKGFANLAKNYVSFVEEGWKWLQKTGVRADLVYTFEVSPMTQALIGVWYAKKYNVPHFLYVTDLWPENVEYITGIHHPLIIYPIQKMVDYIYKNSTKIFTCSKSFIPKIKERGICSENIEFWLQYAEEFYQPAEKRDLADIPDNGRFQIMFAGNIGYAQGLELLVEAAEVLSKEGVQICFTIIGDGSYKEELVSKIAESGLGAYFWFIERKPAEQIPSYFAFADALLVILSKSEVFSITLPSKTQSCMACGKPLLVSADGEIQDLVSGANAGLVSSAGDVGKFVENIKRMLLMDEEELRQMGQNAFSYAKKNFNKEKLMGRLDEVFCK